MVGLRLIIVVEKQILNNKIIKRRIIKRSLTLCFLSMAFSCDDDRNCFTVISKVFSNGQYLLIGSFNSNGISTMEDLTVGFADVNLEVNQADYNSYEIGDKYCYE